MTELAKGSGALRAWLSAHGVTQRAMSNRLSVSQATICNILKGEARPGLALAERIDVGTRYPDAGARAAVAGVPASLWLTERERGALAPLRSAAAAVRKREREDTISAVARWADEMRAERSLLIVEISDKGPSRAAMSRLLNCERMISAAADLTGG